MEIVQIKRKHTQLEKILIATWNTCLIGSISLLPIYCEYSKSKEQETTVQIEKFEDRDNIRGYDALIINDQNYQIIQKGNNYQLTKKQ